MKDETLAAMSGQAITDRERADADRALITNPDGGVTTPALVRLFLDIAADVVATFSPGAGPGRTLVTIEWGDAFCKIIGIDFPIQDGESLDVSDPFASWLRDRISGDGGVFRNAGWGA